MAILLSVTLAACSDAPPVAPVTSASEPQSSRRALDLPVDSIDDNPFSLAIAKEVPEFGGAYFDDQGQLVVALTDVTRRANVEGRVRAHLGTHETKTGVVDGATARLVSRTVAYRFIDLARYRTVLRDRIFAIPGVVSLDVKESANRVSIGIETPGVELQVRKVLSEMNIPQAAVITWQVPRPRTSSHTLSGSMGDIHGGWAIRNANNGGCTLGFAALRWSNGSSVFVTNSHCTITSAGYDGGAIFQSGVNIGTELLDPPTWNCGVQQCRNSDAALISSLVPMQLGRIARTTSASSCEDCSAPLTIDHANPTLQITGKSDHIIENATLHKIGRTTGWTFGAVEDACADYSIDGWVKLCSDRVDFSANGGDSGSPVFTLKTDGTITLNGILYGYVGYPYSDAVISNITRVQQDLGVLTVYDPGPPNASIDGPYTVQSGSSCTWRAIVGGGVPPYTYQWSGLASGNSHSVTVAPQSSDFLYLTITDFYNRSSATSFYVTVEGGWSSISGPSAESMLICPQ